jgi:hypothetical protein
VLKVLLEFASGGEILLGGPPSAAEEGAVKTPTPAEMTRRQSAGSASTGDVKQVFDPYTGDMVDAPTPQKNKRQKK